MKILGIMSIVGAVLVGMIVLSFGIKLIFFPVHTAENMVKTAYDANDKIINADNAIYNYEWFKQQVEDIKAKTIMLDNASIAVDSFEQSAGERVNWTFEDKNEYNRLNTIKLGTKNQLEQMTADYNARAKMATRNIFEDSVLPSYIDALTFIKK